MSFNIGLSGLAAANKALDVTGNNIANVATTGFKASRTEFADQYAASIKATAGSTTVGSGVQTQSVAQLFNQGNISTTDQSLDLAINGDGFFTMSDNGTKVYTRAGAFSSDKSGYIVDSSGANLQGYSVDANGTLQTGVLSNLKIDTSNLSPKPTSTMSETLNLNSSAATPTVTPFDATNVNSYNFTYNTEIFDSQGNSHQLNQYFAKDSSNNWTMYTTVDGRNPTDPTNTTTGTDPLVNPISFTSSGALDTANITTPVSPAAAGLSVVNGVFSLANWSPATQNAAGTWVSNGSTASAAITLDMTSVTQYNATSAVTAKTQDGYATGELSSLSVDSSGSLFATFTNGQSKTIGQVAIANFANVQGLTPIGGTKWKESYASGVPVIGTPETGTLGSIQSNALEDSNVDLTSELVNLIKEQSNYQANAKTISTQSTIMQTLIQSV
ncbi:flagellar hook protein FlgE [Pseudomonas baltica]|uniref:flagellar hook protein FlgE n=1 Tax=Pseudomonas baltica TaxID=2762576 RepID=UPI00289B63D9|nr:flagellar hook protein FlgE [Pseudomonas baltica]